MYFQYKSELVTVYIFDLIYKYKKEDIKKSQMIKHFLIKIITNLRNPFKIPQKILRKINYFFKLRNYDFNFYKNNKIFFIHLD